MTFIVALFGGVAIAGIIGAPTSVVTAPGNVAVDGSGNVVVDGSGNVVRFQ